MTRKSTNSRTAAIALSALVLYPFAIHLPMLHIEQLGHHNEASIFDGVATLLADGQWFVGTIVLLCSIILPVTKLLGLLVLSAGGVFLPRPHHRAWTYRFVEWTGRWGMLDVLAVSVLVAVLKLRTSVDLAAGPGAAAFAVVVILSLLASASFDPHSMWEGVSIRSKRSRTAASSEGLSHHG